MTKAGGVPCRLDQLRLDAGSSAALLCQQYKVCQKNLKLWYFSGPQSFPCQACCLYKQVVQTSMNQALLALQVLPGVLLRIERVDGS